MTRTPTSQPPERYAVTSVLRACAIVRLLEEHPEGLRLGDIAEATNLNKATAFRLVSTLRIAGGLDRLGAGVYRLSARGRQQVAARVGYASQTDDVVNEIVSDSIAASAVAQNIAVVTAENRYSATAALKAVKGCDPLHVPDKYADYYPAWKSRTVYFDPSAN